MLNLGNVITLPLITLFYLFNYDSKVYILKNFSLVKVDELQFQKVFFFFGS